jgi:membrane-associated phospholipid phosphatase
MASELGQRPFAGRMEITRLGRHIGLTTNLSLSRRLIARRRRDLRFRVFPYDRLQVANGGAVLLTLLFALVFVFDPLLVAWQAALPDRVVAVFGSVTRFGKSDWILIGTGLFVILMLVLDASELRPRLRIRRFLRTLAAFYVFASVASSGIVANLCKYAIGRARPKLFPETGSVSFDFWSGDASWASFPSGHATTAMALGVSLALLFPRLRWVFLCLGFWIAASRLFILQHYPSDMFAGCLLGGASAWVMARALARHRLIFGLDPSGRLVRRDGASGRLY